jgi:hypothetical protein
MVTVKQTFKLYDIVNRHFNNENDSRSFIYEIEEIMDNKVDLKTIDFATKKDLIELHLSLQKDIAEQGVLLRKEIYDLSLRMEAGFRSVEQSFKGVEQSLKDQLKWVIILMMSALSLMMAFSKFT